jgi:hypothetical protein
VGRTSLTILTFPSVGGDQGVGRTLLTILNSPPREGIKGVGRNVPLDIFTFYVNDNEKRKATHFNDISLIILTFPSVGGDQGVGRNAPFDMDYLRQ